MKSTCCRCVGHSDPSGDIDANTTFCGSCSRKLETLSRDAEEYQRQLNSGDTSLTPTSEDDARRLSRAVTKRRTA